MKRYVLFAILAVACAGYVAAGGSAQKPVLAKAASATSSKSVDRAAIEQLWVNYAKSVMTGDIEGYLALHDPNAYKMPQDRPMFQIGASADALRQKWAKAAKLYTTEMRIDPKEIVIMGNYAYTMGTYYKKSTPKAGGKALITDGKFLTVLRKESDGTWKIFRDCYNNNAPAAS